MAVIKNNIVPITEATQTKGRFMPKKNLIRVNLSKDVLAVTSEETTYTFTKSFLLPDDCRTDDGIGSKIYRIGGTIALYANNTADPLTFNVLYQMLYGSEIEGTTLSENTVVDAYYGYACSPHYAVTTGNEPNKNGLFAHIYNIAGTLDLTLNATSIGTDGMAYWETNCIDHPNNFDIKTVNPMALMVLETSVTVGVFEDSTGTFELSTFVDFQNLKD